MNLDGNDEFENIVIFVSDALRYDNAVSSFGQENVTKTIASGISSPGCFASIITGLYPPQHGVLGFEHQMNRSIPTLFDLLPNPSFHNEGKELGKVLGTTDRVTHDSLEEMEPPFVYFERCLIPHAPYGYDVDEYEDSVRTYCKETKIDSAIEDYHQSADRSIKKFNRRIQTLEERGLLDDTLVILTADHGQLLGERGVFGHGNFTAPDVVYVPTVFYNESVEPSDDWMAHIDILPTISHAIGGDTNFADDGPGSNLFDGADSHRMIFNQLDKDEWSVWDGSGGILFRNRSLAYRIAWWGYLISRSSYGPLNRKQPMKMLKTSFTGFRKDSVRYQDPQFNADDAKQFGEEIISRGITTQTRVDIDTEHLENLGYLDT